MRMLILSLGLVLIAAVPAAAQQVRLRAIEQPTLSRLSLPLNGAEFEMSKVAPRQFELLLNQTGVRFDTRQVFPDRLVSRVISARQVKDPNGSRLRFILNCDCAAETRVARGALLIEFYDTDASEEEEAADRSDPSREQPDLSEAEVDPAVGRAFEAEAEFDGRVEIPAETPEQDQSPQPAVEAPVLDTATAPLRAPQPIKKPSPVLAVNTPSEDLPDVVQQQAGASVDLADTADEAIAELLEAEPDPEQDEELRIARDKLLEQLTRAAEQGLLEFASPEGEASPLGGGANLGVLAGPEAFSGEAEFAGPDTAATSGRSAQEGSDGPRPLLELPVRARTSIDRDFVAARRDTIVPVDVCEANALLSRVTWLDPKDPARALAALRGEILGEFDQPRPEIIERLVTLYISIGFGIEARRLLELYGEALPDRRVYQDLASIVDGDPVVWGEGIAANGPCSGSVALWLAAAGLRDLDEYKTDETDAELLDAFALMPLGMRKLLGPRILTNAVDEGNLELARKIDQLLQRSGGELGPALNLALGRLISLDGRPEAAEAIFTRIAASRGELATEALLRLVESKLKRGAPISEIERQELAFAAYIYRGDPEGRFLQLTELQARAGGAGLPEVLSELKRHLNEAPEEAAEYRDIGHLLLEESDRDSVGDAAYTQAVLAYADEISPTAAGDAARARIARELTGAGLANLALDQLQVALVRAAPEVRLAAGEALVALFRGEEALAQLEGVELPEAQAIRVRAHKLQAAHAEALELAAQSADDAQEIDVADLAWRAGEWETAADQGPEARRLLAAVMAGQDAAEAQIDPDRDQAFLAPPELPAQASLKSSQEVLDGSATVREIIEEALGDG
ncbi:MAG: hypothetical protein AAGH74_00260 [Pseudomonadota bacterium]